MNRHQILFSWLLAAVLRNKDIENIDIRDVDWEGIYKEAIAHQVHTIIYPIVRVLIPNDPINDILISKWKKEVLLSGMTQIQHVEQIGRLFIEFNKEKIPFIALKGLVLRELYPNPEMRTMGDGDILIEKNHMKEAEKILLRNGYKKLSDDSKHIHFVHKNHLSIELHHHLINNSLNKEKISEFEDRVWKNARIAAVCSKPAHILSNEDQILHLCLHMAVHLSSSGFGLRQLCDLSVEIESKKNQIDWNDVFQKTNKYGITTFVTSLLIICNKLLKNDIPGPYQGIYMDEHCIECLIEDIFSGGNFGRKLNERKIFAIQQPYMKYNDSGYLENSLYSTIQMLFPSRNKLGERYSYVKKYPFLVFAAWVHRIILGIFRKDFNMYEKKSFLIPNLTSSVLIQRIKLLHWMDLK